MSNTPSPPTSPEDPEGPTGPKSPPTSPAAPAAPASPLDSTTEDAPRGRVTPLRILAWGLLVLALAAVTVAYLRGQFQPPPAAPPKFDALPDFALTHYDGRRIRLADLAGEPFVADFIFTRCTAACPVMTDRMLRIGDRIPEDRRIRRVSVTVDPEHDTVEVLRAYAEARQLPEDWFLLTGDAEAIRTLSWDGFKLGFQKSEDEAVGFEHSTKLVLVDREGRIRGYYDAFDAQKLDQLVEDLKGLWYEAENRP